MRSTLRIAALLGGTLALGACASLDPDAAVAPARQWLDRAGTPAVLTPRRAEADREALAQERAAWLAAEVGEREALQLALGTSAAAQAVLAEGWRAQWRESERGAPPGLLWHLERNGGAADRERAWSLGFSLSEWVTWPWRQAAAERALTQRRLELARELLLLQRAVRTQWVQAVAAREQLTYQAQVTESAELSLALAERLQAAGNISRLRVVREQLAAQEARQRLERATLDAERQREALVRRLGLDGAEAQRLRLPAQLPAPPDQVPAWDDVRVQGERERLDLALARAALARAGGDAGPVALAHLGPGIELGRTRSADHTAVTRGLSLDLGALASGPRRLSAADAEREAARWQLEAVVRAAGSQLREQHAVVEATHRWARQSRAAVQLRRTISDETVLRYNGMLVSAFEVLTEARGHAAAVVDAIDARRAYWLARLDLDAALLGLDTDTPSLRQPSPAATSAVPHGGHP